MAELGECTLVLWCVVHAHWRVELCTGEILLVWLWQRSTRLVSRPRSQELLDGIVPRPESVSLDSVRRPSLEEQEELELALEAMLDLVELCERDW